MQLKQIQNAILISSLLAASTTFAASDIYKCVDQAGRTTLTDEPCESGAKAVVLAAGGEEEQVATPAPARAAVASLERLRARVAPAVGSNWAHKLKAAPAMTRDIATLKAARATMQMMDSTAAASRSQRLAALN